MKKIELPITGMTCAHCAARIENGLSKLPGVESANVNFATERATINYDSEVASENDFLSLIRNFGYDVALEPVEKNSRASIHAGSGCSLPQAAH